ncbi:unnamed protein product, partial [Mesorhabditis spiculigera]
LNRYLEDHQEEAREALVIQWFLDQLPTLGNDYETIRKTYSSPYDYKPLDTYCLDKMMKNSKDFSRAYKCPLNSPMNPEKKCCVWRHKKDLIPESGQYSKRRLHSTIFVHA